MASALSPGPQILHLYACCGATVLSRLARPIIAKGCKSPYAHTEQDPPVRNAHVDDLPCLVYRSRSLVDSCFIPCFGMGAGSRLACTSHSPQGSHYLIINLSCCVVLRATSAPGAEFYARQKTLSASITYVSSTLKTFLLLIPHPDHVRLLMSAESRLASVLNFIIDLQAISWELFPDLPVSCLLNKLHSAPALSCLAPQTPIPVDQNQAQKRSAGHATRKIW